MQSSRFFPMILAIVVLGFLGASGFYLWKESQPEKIEAKRATIDLKGKTNIPSETWMDIAKRTDLGWLGLDESGVTDEDLGKLGAMPGMTHLNLEGTGVSDKAAQAIGSMKDLEWIGLVGTNVGSDSIVFFKTLPKLNTLRMDKTKIDDKCMVTLAELPLLGFLTVSKTSLTDEGLKALGGSKSLRKLDVRETKITREGLAEFLKLAPSCQVLSSVGGGGGPPGGKKGAEGGFKGPPRGALENNNNIKDKNPWNLNKENNVIGKIKNRNAPAKITQCFARCPRTDLNCPNSNTDPIQVRFG